MFIYLYIHPLTYLFINVFSFIYSLCLLLVLFTVLFYWVDKFLLFIIFLGVYLSIYLFVLFYFIFIFGHLFSFDFNLSKPPKLYIKTPRYPGTSIYDSIFRKDSLVWHLCLLPMLSNSRKKARNVNVTEEDFCQHWSKHSFLTLRGGS